MLNPTDKVRVTSLVVVLNPTVLIPTPLELPVGIIIGLTGLIPVVLLRILTWESPNVYCKSISLTCFLVSPSNNNKVGATAYPFPTEAIPIDPIDAKDFICITCGNATVGLKVVSDGKLKPIFCIFVFLIRPILELPTLITALLPNSVVIVLIPGRE